MVTAVGRKVRQKAIYWSGRIPRRKTGELQNHVELTVPYGTTELEMFRFVLQKLSWIKRTRHRNEYSKTEVESFRAYIAGVVEVVRTSGSGMTLKVEAPFGNVKVNAGLEYSLEALKEFVEENTDYILKRRAYLRERFPQGVEYESGYRLTLWGQEVVLEVEEVEDGFGVTREGDVLRMRVRKNATREERCDRLRYFLGEQVIEEGEPLWLKYQRLMDIEIARIESPYLTASWSTCSFRTNKMRLNADLARHPKFMLEFNIVFQLCNFLRSEKGGDFYDHLDRYYPNWRKGRGVREEDQHGHTVRMPGQAGNRLA